MRRVGIGKECDMTTHLIKLICSSCGVPPRPEVQFLLYITVPTHTSLQILCMNLSQMIVYQYSISSEPWLVFVSY